MCLLSLQVRFHSIVKFKKKKKSPGFFFCSWSSAAYQTARHLFFTVYYIINYSDIWAPLKRNSWLQLTWVTGSWLSPRVAWNCLFSSEYACICYALGKGNSRENCALISVSVRVWFQLCLIKTKKLTVSDVWLSH